MLVGFKTCLMLVRADPIRNEIPGRTTIDIVFGHLDFISTAPIIASCYMTCVRLAMDFAIHRHVYANELQ